MMFNSFSLGNSETVVGAVAQELTHSPKGRYGNLEIKTAHVKQTANENLNHQKTWNLR